MLRLPEADPAPLRVSPLELVVCQVRFEETMALADGKVILGIHEDLGGKSGRFSRLDPLKSPQVQLGDSGFQIELPSSSQRAGWRLVSDDGSWVATVVPDSASLETLRYSTWGDFEDCLSQLVMAIERRVGPAVEQRLGLRYVNRLTSSDIDRPSQWAGRVSPEFLGPISHEVLGEGVSSTQAQIELQIEGGVRCLLRYGVVPDPGQAKRTTYIIDIDVYRQSVEPFNSEGILKAAADFNGIALSVFQQALTKEYWVQLREGELKA